MDADTQILQEVARDYPDYLRDESRRTGSAASISFPVTEEDVIAQLAYARQNGWTVTVQGARTGITGGAVPGGGHVLNLSRMKAVLGLRREAESGDFVLTVQPGVLLSEIQECVERKSFDTSRFSPSSRDALDTLTAGAYFFAPDPTETSASAGGMTACNASGAHSFAYGPMRRHVARVRAVLADGSVVDLKRGAQRANGRAFSLRADAGRVIAGTLPSYRMPAVKNAAGYYAEDNMDLVDLFVGSEGTLGIFTEIDLRLAPAPAVSWGVLAFLPGEPQAIRLVTRVQKARGQTGRAAAPVAVELFSAESLDLLRRQKASNPAFEELPALPPAWHTGIYVEFQGDSEDAVENAVVAMSEWMAACGGNEEATWLAADDRERQRLKTFRHAVPEAVNLLIDERRRTEPRLTKLGTDLAVPDAALQQVMSLYRRDLDAGGFEYVMFGHIGNNHVHVNIIPRNLEEYERGKALYRQWAHAVIGMGGTVSAEHGIGKLKTELLAEMYGAEGLEEMRAVKAQFDPDGILNPGNLFGNP